MQANNLNITLLQTDLVWENVPANLAHFEQLIFGLNQATDVIILPEMFTTGFSMNPHLIAANYQEKTLNTLAEWAQRKDVAICGSFMIEEDSKFYNRFFWVNPNSEFYFYDKAHLFRMGQEQMHYHKGNAHLLIQYKGWKIAPFICYDLRFPVWMRRTKEFNYDLIILVANWPQKRAAHWKALTIARAIENQSFLAAVNRIGEDVHQINHSGDSCIIQPTGELIYEANKSISFENICLNIADLNQYRQQFPAWEDADTFEII